MHHGSSVFMMVLKYIFLKICVQTSSTLKNSQFSVPIDAAIVDVPHCAAYHSSTETAA